MKRLLLIGWFIATGGSMPAQVKDTAKASRIWKDSGAGADVLAATFVGGSGHEWLCSGGFQHDGSIVLVGNIIGPDFAMPVNVGIIGKDGAAPAEASRVPVIDKGKPKVGKNGKPEYERPSYRHEGVTGFVMRVSDDMKKILSIHRLPWRAGAITAAAIGKDDEILIAGKANDGFGDVGGEMVELPGTVETKGNASCNHCFIACLASDGSKSIWGRHVRIPAAAPTVSVTESGDKIQFGAGKLFTFDRGGKLLETTEVPGGLKPTASVSPSDGSVVVGGEHHWPTGREPWRCPTLNIHHPDGKLAYQFYDWGGPYVGLDNCRQVSDSAVRFVTHDADGGILLYCWSDGGNSVMTTEPFDVRRPVGHKGLGLTAAGAGVLSCSYLIRLDPKDYHVTAWTFWCAQAASGKPNSIWVQTMKRTPDKALAMAGMGASLIWQTANRLSEADASGEYIAVLSKDFSQLRFCSVVPGSGVAEVSDGSASRGCQWGVAAGVVKGKTRVLFLGSAEAGKLQDGQLTPTPTKNAMQDKFGGGWCDGYAVLVELPGDPGTPAVDKKESAGPTRASFEVSAKGKDPRRPGRIPVEGTEFHFLSTYPKHATADVEIRERSGQKWPNFWWGHSVEGAFVYKEKGPEARLKIACRSLCQPNGEQGRRVLGALVTDPKTPPEVVFTIDSIGAPMSTDIPYLDKGQKKTRQVEYFDAKATLAIGEKQVAIQPRLTAEYGGPKEGPVDTVRLSAYATVNPAELGLNLPKDDLVDVRISFMGTIQSGPAPKTKK